MAIREFSVGVTFRDFAALAKLTGWTAEDLAREFPGIAASDGGFSGETSGTYFERVLRGHPGWEVVIPYRSVVEKYLRETRLLIAAGKLRSCKCGCGSPLFSPRQQFAHEASTRADGDGQYAAAADGRV